MQVRLAAWEGRTAAPGTAGPADDVASFKGPASHG